ARRRPVAAGAAVVLILICLVALLAPVIAPYKPNDIDLLARLSAPGGKHLLGTDEYGRDVLTRVIYGGRVSLAAGLGATALGTAVGVLFGLLSGYVGGFVELVIQRWMDAIMALPPIILLMVLATTLSPNLRNVIIAIAVFVTPGSARIVRGAVLSVKAMTYVEAAEALGVSPVRIVWRHVLPNVVAPVIVVASITVGSVIIIEAALGFLGLSVHEPTATWGNMLNTGAQSYMEQAPWLALAPGIAIAVTVFAINLFGDGLRDALDPRLRGR
ncbi:MAG TPA: ABC transporter permease, partial [Dehalococcoidia bacterium]|nr:ABC transporter permease [Dehalococcoidia bacterium]